MIEMKNSGIEWIGEIPAEWICDKVCRQFALIGSGTTPKSDNDSNYIGNIHWIQSGDINGGILYNTKNKVSNEVIEKYSALKVYKAPFIVIAMYGASIGNISSSIIDGCVNQACCVLSEGHMNIKYAFYTLKSAKDYLIYNGVGGGQPNISQDIVKQLRLPVPSIREQEMIADYLDKKCAEIDAVIEKTKATIEEYKKLKQSIITEAVTKGIRGDRPMKDSGVAWIGSIPADWSVSKIKIGVTKVGSGKTPLGGAESYAEEGVLFLRSQNVYDTGLLLDSPTYITESVDEEMKSTRVYPRDVLLNITGGSIGRCCIFPEEYIRANVNQHVSIIRVIASVFLPEYMHYYWLSSLGHTAIDLYQTGGNREGMSADAIKNSPIPVIPIEEQQEIVAYLDKKCAEMDTLIARKTALWAELESYKKSVIYEYVTGKKEVG